MDEHCVDRADPTTQFTARRANGLANAQLRTRMGENAKSTVTVIFGASVCRSVCLRLVVNERLHPSHFTVHHNHTMVKWP